MPELPEVETTRRDLEPHIVGRTITDVWVAGGGVQPQAPLTPAQFRDAVAGRRIERLDRRGKYLIAALSGDLWLVLHRRMTGNLLLRPAGAPHDRFLRAIFYLDGPAVESNPAPEQSDYSAGTQAHIEPVPVPAPRSLLPASVELHWEDQRRFGTWRLVSRLEDAVPGLGPEPLDGTWTVADLAAALRGRSAPVKAVLLDQRRVAGLGNIYADEALHETGIHPGRAAGSLTEPEAARLHAAIRSVLEKAIRLQGSTSRNYLGGLGQRGSMQDEWRVYDRTGQPCYRCGNPLQKTRLAGRGTHFCPVCQVQADTQAG